jgi:hypothetical protein
VQNSRFERFQSSQRLARAAVLFLAQSSAAALTTGATADSDGVSRLALEPR